MRDVVLEDGVIRGDEAYTLTTARKRLSLGGAAMRAAFRSGLKAKKIGNRKYLLGKDIISFLERQDDCSDVE